MNGPSFYLRRWRSDVHLRVTVSLYGALLWNTAYAVFQLVLGLWHRSFWFCSLAGYYIALAVMRLRLLRHANKGEKVREELLQYRACGWVLLMMNLALALIVFFMVYWNRTFVHHKITTIAMATYTFTAFAMAIVGIVKYRKLGSPVYSAAKVISLASACVSMLTLTSTMLTAFGAEMPLATRRIFLGATGGTVSAFIVVMAVYMICTSNKNLKAFKE